jgi:hypothetical protein
MAARDCPNCGREIAVLKFACAACWRRLPRSLKQPILRAYARLDWDAHMAAKEAAAAWYAANPEETQ